MDALANGADMMPCPHCGEEMRRGMIRCRQCGKSPTESTESPDDFQLSGHELVQHEEPRCALCGAVLEPGSDDCPACTSALLDQLLKGPENGRAGPAPHGDAPWPSSAAAELHVRRARMAPAAPGSSAAPSSAPSAPRAAPAREEPPEPARPARSADAPTRRAASQPAASTRTAPAKKQKRAPAPEPAPEPAYSEPTEEDLASATTPVETTAACTALLASLAKADVILRCEIATALGKLGDKQAMGPLERHMGDPDIRVRRAVANALVQLGHPKGQTLIDIAERKPAKEVLAFSSPPKKKPARSSGSSMDPDTLKKILGGVLAVALVAGGIWYFFLAPPSKPSYGGKGKKGKAAAAAKKAPAKKAPVRPKAAAE